MLTKFKLKAFLHSIDYDFDIEWKNSSEIPRISIAHSIFLLLSLNQLHLPKPKWKKYNRKFYLSEFEEWVNKADE